MTSGVHVRILRFFLLCLAVMAFVTYILVAGLVMGTQNRYSKTNLD